MSSSLPWWCASANSRTNVTKRRELLLVGRAPALRVLGEADQRVEHPLDRPVLVHQRLDRVHVLVSSGSAGALLREASLEQEPCRCALAGIHGAFSQTRPAPHRGAVAAATSFRYTPVHGWTRPSGHRRRRRRPSPHRRGGDRGGAVDRRPPLGARSHRSAPAPPLRRDARRHQPALADRHHARRGRARLGSPPALAGPRHLLPARGLRVGQGARGAEARSSSTRSSRGSRATARSRSSPPTGTARSSRSRSSSRTSCSAPSTSPTRRGRGCSRAASRWRGRWRTSSPSRSTTASWWRRSSA